MSTAETVAVMIGYRCPTCGATFPRRRSLAGHAAGAHGEPLLPWRSHRASVDVPRPCAFGADGAPLTLP